MQCPYCGREMERGLIQSPYEIAWCPGEKRRMMMRSEFYNGSVCLSKPSLRKGSAVIAYLCRDCEKVLIDYKNLYS